MNLRSRLDALRDGAASEDPAHARVDAVLRALAAPDLRVLRDVLDRWERSGHPASSVPASAALEPDDTGNLLDPRTKTLVATAEEWTVFQRVVSQLD